MLLRRTLLAVLSLGGGGLRAAFELSAQLPAALADGPVTVSRESLETKDLTPVATGRFAGGRGRVRVDAGPGLFRLSMGGEREVAFVAGEGQTLRIEVGEAGRGLRVVGGADQELFARYEALRAESLARLVLPARAAGDTEGEVAGYRAHRRELNDFTVERLKGSAALYAASLRWDGDYRLEELAAVVVGEFAGKFSGCGDRAVDGGAGGAVSRDGDRGGGAGFGGTGAGGRRGLARGVAREGGVG
jgi:hypothetical protein